MSLKPRADFICEGACGEGHVSLPVTATLCPDPECGGPLRRIWAPVGTISDKTKIVDRVVGPEYERNAARKGSIAPGFESKPLSPVPAFNMVGPEGKLASQTYSMGTLDAAKQFGGPKPDWYRGG